MKKLLLIAALLLAVTTAAVACTENDTGDGTADTTVAQTTTADDGTDAGSTEDATDTAVDPTAPAETTLPAEPEETTRPVTDAPTEPPTAAPTEPPTEPEPKVPHEPAYIADADTLNNINKPCATLGTPVRTDNYLTFHPENGDPYYYPFANMTGGRYVAIKYRTTVADGMSVQFYLASSGTGPSDDTSMLKQPIVADGEWQVAWFDTQSLIEAGIYDGSTISYFRFDPMECDYKLDANGQPYKENGIYVRYPKPDGAYIDVEYVAFFDSEEQFQMFQNKPAHTISIKDLADNAAIAGDPSYNQLMTAQKSGTYITLTGTGEDAYLTGITVGSDLAATKLLAIKYRTAVAGIQGQIFVGSGSNWTGQEDNISFDYEGDGQWHLLLVDLNQVPALTGNVNFLRYDFFKHGIDPETKEAHSIDIQYMAFFENEEQAKAYDTLYDASLPVLATDKTIYKVGEPILVTAVGTGTDWVGLAHADATSSVRWFYLNPVEGYIAAQSGVAFDICGEANYNNGVDSTVTAGDYIIYLMANDQPIQGNTPIATLEITVIE